jgi:hypothetical protein
MCESQRTEREGEEERGDLHDWWVEGAAGVVARLRDGDRILSSQELRCYRRGVRTQADEIRSLTDYFSSVISNLTNLSDSVCGPASHVYSFSGAEISPCLY